MRILETQHESNSSTGVTVKLQWIEIFSWYTVMLAKHVKCFNTCQVEASSWTSFNLAKFYGKHHHHLKNDFENLWLTFTSHSISGLSGIYLGDDSVWRQAVQNGATVVRKVPAANQNHWTILEGSQRSERPLTECIDAVESCVDPGEGWKAINFLLVHLCLIY